jgi:hypothetical protein
LSRKIPLREAGEGDRAKRGGGGAHGSCHNGVAAKGLALAQSKDTFNAHAPAPSTMLRMVPLTRCAGEEFPYPNAGPHFRLLYRGPIPGPLWSASLSR